MVSLTALIGRAPGPGHGECFVWDRKNGNPTVAIDAGGAAAVGAYAATFSPSTLVLSHDDRDHIAGAAELIDTAGSLKELWVPVEWSILIKQIAATPEPVDPSSDGVTIDVPELERDIGDQLDAAHSDDRVQIGTTEATGTELLALVEAASGNLESWTVSGFEDSQGFKVFTRADHTESWYGAKDLEEILRRVRFRARTLIKIFRTALNHQVHIRFFSIDLALLARARPAWLNAGQPGTVTVANASEAPNWSAVVIPPGIAYTYALTKITVQNRRALSTLLWRENRSTDKGTLIWSDTDGAWLDRLMPRGFDRVVRELSASSAPHHASSNAAHARVWRALQSAPANLVMISAGGQKNQGYAADYVSLGNSRCCTWCRPSPPPYQQVCASSNTSGGPMLLRQACLNTH